MSTATAGYDATTGAMEWVKRYGPGDGFATALGVSPDESAVFVTGTSLSDYGTVAYAPYDDRCRWSVTQLIRDGSCGRTRSPSIRPAPGGAGRTRTGTDRPHDPSAAGRYGISEP
jgi:hypothetical protein